MANESRPARYADLDRSALREYEDSRSARFLARALAVSLVLHAGFVIVPLLLAGVFDTSERTMQLSATAATSKSFDVRLKQPRPLPQPEKKDDGQKAKDADGANVKHVSRFNSDVLREHTQSIWNSITYPRMARRMGWQGRVRVQAVVDATGRVLEARVVEGSGYGILDEAALSGVQSHQFTPGESTETIFIVLRFKLTGP